MEFAVKKVDLSKAYVLANCFLNLNTIKCKYHNLLNLEIENNCPDIFKKELRIPEFYLELVKKKLLKEIK